MEINVPPQSIEAERAVIGSILIDEAAMGQIADIVRAEYFYDPRHALLMEHIISLYNQNKPIDALTLTESLKTAKKFKQSGGATYLSDIISSVPSSANVIEYSKIVKEKAVRRELISFSAKLTELARKEEEKLDTIIDEIERNVLNVSRDNTTADFLDIASLVEKQIELADEYAKNPNALRGLPTGIESLDKILGGLHKSDLIILAARPSVGKSAFAFNIARYSAVEQKKTVAIFSLEMPAIQLITRMLAQQAEVDMWKIRVGGLNDEKEYANFSIASGKLADSKIFIDETPGISIVQLRSKARKLMMEHGLDLIVIDYLQLMQGSKSSDNRAQEVGEISRSLKILARELNIPVIALSQLNRAVETRDVRKPQLSDLRESGSIEQDADLVIFLSRDLSNDKEDMADNITKVGVHIAKHRNGPIGDIALEFIASQQRYREINI